MGVRHATGSFTEQTREKYMKEVVKIKLVGHLACFLFCCQYNVEDVRWDFFKV